MARGKHVKATGGAHAKRADRNLLTTFGYPLAFAALFALAIGPGYAIATEAGSDAASQAAGAQVASAKDETVYVFANADGTVKNVEVSDKLTNADKASELADSSTLTNIENVEGDDSYSGSGDDMVWSAGGNDIYYRGDSDRALPISVSVLYKLDGRAVSADELAGKSGKVEITYSFQNKTEAQDGVQVPLAAITGMLFDNDSFSDIEVDNGRVVDDGDRVVVIGYAMPGLASSLDVDADTIDIPTSFTVSAQTTGFELGSTLTMVTGNLFDSVNMDDFDTGELSDASSGLKDAMSQLIDGSGQLADGMATLQNGTSALPDGVQKLYDGSGDLADGLDAAADGVSSLASGAKDLDGYVSQLSTGIATADKGANELSSGLAVLPATLNTLKTKLSQAKAASDGATQTIAAAVDKIKGSSNYAADANLQTAVAMLGSGQLPTGTYGASYYTQAVSAGLQEAVTGISSSESDVKDAVDGAASLASGLDTLSTSAQQISKGASQLSTGASTLNERMPSAVEGAKALKKGLGTLNTSTGSLVSGIAQLVEGTTQLKEGLVQFNDEGITKITDFLDGDLLKATDNLEAVRDAGESYDNFSGITEGTTGTVKFVIETDAIEQAD